jgi:hypothetical protein
MCNPAASPFPYFRILAICSLCVAAALLISLVFLSCWYCSQFSCLGTTQLLQVCNSLLLFAYSFRACAAASLCLARNLSLIEVSKEYFPYYLNHSNTYWHTNVAQ